MARRTGSSNASAAGSARVRFLEPDPRRSVRDPVGRAVFYVTVLSVLALVPNFSSETPTETEDE